MVVIAFAVLLMVRGLMMVVEFVDSCAPTQQLMGKAWKARFRVGMSSGA